jgi:hypothetical protein
MRRLLGHRQVTSALALCMTLAACQLAPPPLPVGPEPAQPMVEYVSEQEILTPLPLRVRLPARYEVDRVLVLFRTWGSLHWSSTELSRAGQTWTGEVSCREVSTVTGETQYYFLAVDARGQPVIGSGSPEWPHVATVVTKLQDGPHALAGMPRPERCYDIADCPPDFVGCPAYAWKRPACREDADCPGTAQCGWDGYCASEVESARDLEQEAALASAMRVALRKADRSASGR